MRFGSLSLAAATLLLATPSLATPLPPGSSNVPFMNFDTATQGTELAFQQTTGVALTFTGDLRTAVYRNTLGFLDFYYQVQRTGPGTIGNDDIRTMTAANFQGFLVDALFSNADLDGAGGFTAANHSGGIGTANRNASGGVVGADFSMASLSGTETGSIYIFRTNATRFDHGGTFGVSDGSTFSGLAYQPIAGSVPEPGTWAMLLAGFGVIGMAVRRRRIAALA